AGRLLPSQTSSFSSSLSCPCPCLLLPKPSRHATPCHAAVGVLTHRAYNGPFDMTKYRWLMLGLLFAATTVNYLDRIVLGVVIKNIREDFHISDSDYGNITAAFQFAYMIGFLLAGWLIDRLGTKVGYAISIAWWSVAAVLHGLASGAWSLAFWRGMLGLGEAGNFPSAIKAVAEWFP